VFGGLLLSTVLNLFFTPALYLLMESGRERFMRRRSAGGAPSPHAETR
jgi:hypothetical protein